VVTPGLVRCLDTKLRSRHEPESPVEAGITKQTDQRLIHRRRCAQNFLHQRSPNASALKAGQHTKWAKTKRRHGSVHTSPAATDMPDNLATDQSHQTETFEPFRIKAQLLDKPDLGRLTAGWAVQPIRESGRMDGADR